MSESSETPQNIFHVFKCTSDLYFTNRGDFPGISGDLHSSDIVLYIAAQAASVLRAPRNSIIL